MTQLEHANITVPDVDAALRFLQTAAADFSIRKDGVAELGYRWVHVGNDHSYIALQAAHNDAKAELPHEPYVNYGINHLGLIVSDAIAVETKLRKAGYRQNGPLINDSYRRRIYFYDDAGFEWELVEYLSDQPDQMNLYE